MQSAARRPITAQEKASWAATGHLLVLQALSEASEWTDSEHAFHGGTSLHLMWNSPRFSEDLDFLLDTRAAQRMTGVVQRSLERMQQALLLVDPALQVSLKDKSTERMGHFQFVIEKPGVLGKAMVKLEFWRVQPSYLQSYSTEKRMPAVPTDLGGARLRIDALLPAATLVSAMADKLTAFATRPHLKWRDLFDHWWIPRQAAFEKPTQEELVARFLHHVSAYQTTVPGDPAASLEAFAGRLADPAVAQSAQADLKPFLPEHWWRRVWPDGVNEMVQEAAASARQLAHALRQLPDQTPQAAAAVGTGEPGDDGDERAGDLTRERQR